jgi:hypothetical protein
MRIVRHAPTRAVLFHFDGCADYADMVRKRVPNGYGGGGSWVGGETWEQSLQRAQQGNTDLVPQAEALMDKLAIDAQRDSRIWVADRAGAYPVVPDYLMGRPENMRRLTPQSNDRAPIKLYVELTSSASITAAEMIKRGTAILALAMLLNMERSVELHVLVGLDASADGNRAAFCVVPLGTSPIDIALACNALTSVGFTRSMGYGFLSQSPESRSMGGWEWGLAPDNDRNRQEYVRKLRAALDASPDDMIIPPIHMNDPVLRDPLGFVKRSLAEASKAEEE